MKMVKKLFLILVCFCAVAWCYSTNAVQVGAEENQIVNATEQIIGGADCETSISWFSIQ